MDQKEKKSRSSFLSRLFRPLLTGLITLFPLAVTVLITVWLLGFLKDLMGPQSVFGGLLNRIGFQFVANETVAYLIGMALLLTAVYFFGLLVLTRLNRYWNRLIDRLLKNVPLVNAIYEAAKKIGKLFTMKDDTEFRSMTPVLVSFGGEGGTTMLALLSSNEKFLVSGTECYAVMIPTAPVPVGGAIFYVPAKWVKKTDMSFDHFFNVYMSMGVTAPDYLKRMKRTGEEID